MTLRYLDDVECYGNESSLQQCHHNGVGNHSCGHNDDASFACINCMLLVSIHKKKLVRVGRLYLGMLSLQTRLSCNTF